MPLPSPDSDESRSDWMNRCMANGTMNSEYPDSSQRYAVCSNIWDRKEPNMPEIKFLERGAWHEKAQDDKLEAQFSPLRKGYSTEIKSIDKEDRSFAMAISDGSEDRDKDIISLKGWDLKGYRKNPVVQWAHNHGIPALARSTKTAVDGDSLVGHPKFPDEGIHPFADMIFNLFAAKILKASSVGFVPTKYAWNEERGGYDFEKQTLLEFSLVNVPANPNALVLSQEAGIDITPMVEWAESVLDVFKTPEEVILETGTSTTDLETARYIASGDSVHVPVDGLPNAEELKDGDILVCSVDEEGVYHFERSESLHKKTEPEPKPVEDQIIASITDCPRCGKDHEDVLFVKMGINSKGEHTHWAFCPETTVALMMYDGAIEEKEKEADEPNSTGLDLLLAASSKSEKQEEKVFDAEKLESIRSAVQSNLVSVTGRLD